MIESTKPFPTQKAQDIRRVGGYLVRDVRNITSSNDGRFHGEVRIDGELRRVYSAGMVRPLTRIGSWHIGEAIIQERRGGARVGAGRPTGPQVHLRDPKARRNWIGVSLSDTELAKLERSGKPIALRLYQYAKKGGL